MSVVAGERLHKARAPANFTQWRCNKIVFPFASVCTTESVERSKPGCIICGKKSQRTPFRSVDSVQANADLEACFGFLKKTSGDICEALQHYRNSGKTFRHVSVFLTFMSLILLTLVM